MAYIGKTPVIGNFQVCDAISVVNGQAAYTMQVGSVNVSPESANHMIVSLNGVIQKPTDAYTVSNSVITFASNLVTGDVIDFIQILGNVLDLGVPSDATVSTAKIVDANVTTAKIADANVTLAKLSATGTKDATTFLRGDNSFAVVDTNTVIDLTSDLSGNGFGKMKLKYTEVSVSGTGFVFLGFCRQATNCGGALGEHGIPLGFIPGVEYNASFTVGDLAVEPWPAGSHRYEYKVNISSFTTAGTLGIIYLGAST